MRGILGLFRTLRLRSCMSARCVGPCAVSTGKVADVVQNSKGICSNCAHFVRPCCMLDDTREPASGITGMAVEHANARTKSLVRVHVTVWLL